MFVLVIDVKQFMQKDDIINRPIKIMKKMLTVRSNFERERCRSVQDWSTMFSGCACRALEA